MHIWKKIVGNELYVYWNGSLIYKKWLNTGHSLIFDAYGSPWCPEVMERKFSRIDGVLSEKQLMSGIIKLPKNIRQNI